MTGAAPFHSMMEAKTMSAKVEQASASTDWLDELGALLARHSGMGIGADVASMSLAELRGVYRRLRQLEEHASQSGRNAPPLPWPLR